MKDKNLKALTANEAQALAMKQIEPDVVAAYPITPATQVVEIFSQYVADGEVKTEFIPVESEHSAMSACIGASAAGARVMTATSSQGLVLMQEILNIASGLRFPIVMAEVNRALSAPLNIHGDQSDTMGARDTGWIQIFTSTVQEAYDSMFIALKLAEKVNLPAMVTTDGFILSHCMEAFYSISDDRIKKFIGQRKPEYSLFDFENPKTIGSLDLPDFFYEHKRQQIEAMREANFELKKVQKEFFNLSGRKYDLVEEYKLKDADYGIVVLGSTAETAKTAIDNLRKKGYKIGLLRIRLFRPFPDKEIMNAIKHLKVVAVFDKADAVSGIGGPVYSEVKAALYGNCRGKVLNYIYGLGGRDTRIEQLEQAFSQLKNNENEINYLGVRE
ncbi:pyruvate ferredoxin oxidoreductase [bacterium CG2_30_33_46]|nr:MAG: pyruvate ferredoxin oxidoreductase [bacterium CG2_30_33_46]